MFKYNSVNAKNVVLSRGTRYFDKRPMVFTNWGSSVGGEALSSLPVWVKFSNLLDCYWTGGA